METPDVVTGVRTLVPLAGPLPTDKGAWAATNALTHQPVSYPHDGVCAPKKPWMAYVFGGYPHDGVYAPKKPWMAYVFGGYRGTQGTCICKVFDLAAGQTGASEKFLKRLGKSFQKVYVHPGSHAGYFPGASPLATKVIFDPGDGRILEAQVVGADGVDKRIDVLATAIAGEMTVHDLCHLELEYAPPFGSAKDSVNLAGMVAENLLLGLHRGVHVDQLSEAKIESHIPPMLMNVRTIAEHAAGSIPGSRNNLFV